MKNILSFILVLVFGNMFSQYRFSYRVDFKIDSLNKEYVQSEDFNLDTDGKKSVFYPKIFAKWDSIYNNNGSVSKSKLPDAKLDYYVTKNYKDGKIFFREMIGATIYEVQEPHKLVWKQSGNVEMYQNYKVKKAITDFGKRQWEAWFSEEFPISDGPYKFTGLPGMILKIKDIHSDYEIYLTEVKKIDKLPALDFFNHINIKKLNIDYDTYRKKKKDFKENPALMFIEMGIQMPSEEMKRFSEAQKSMNAKRNNQIELNEL